MSPWKRCDLCGRDLGCTRCGVQSDPGAGCVAAVALVLVVVSLMWHLLSWKAGRPVAPWEGPPAAAAPVTP